MRLIEKIKKGDLKYWQIVLAIALAVTVITVTRSITRNMERKDKYVFSSNNDFRKVEAITYHDGKKWSFVIINEQEIYKLWQFVVNAESPGHKQKKLYDYTVDLYFQADDTTYSVDIYKDEGLSKVEMKFSGPRSSLSIFTYDNDQIVETLVNTIIEKGNPAE